MKQFFKDFWNKKTAIEKSITRAFNLEHKYIFLLNILLDYIRLTFLFTISTIGIVPVIAIHIITKTIMFFGMLIFRCCNYVFKSITKKRKDKKVKKIIDDWEKRILDKDEYYILKGFSTNRDYLINSNIPLKDFIYNFIRYYNADYITYSKYGAYICDYNKRRSLGDIFLICRYYYPYCSMHEILKILVKLLEDKTIAGSYCNQIYKYVFHRQSQIYHRKDSVEYSSEIIFQDLIDVYL